MRKILLTLTAVLAAACSIAQVTDDMLVQLTLSDADLMMATKVLTRKTGIQFFIKPSSQPFQKVTLSLNQVSPDEAIRYICQAAGAYFLKDENGVYIISHEPFNQPTPGQINPVVAPLLKKEKVVKVIPLLYVNGRDVIAQLSNALAYQSWNPYRDLMRFSTMTGTAADPAVTPAMNNSGTPRLTAAPQRNGVRTNAETGSDISFGNESANATQDQGTGSGISVGGGGQQTGPGFDPTQLGSGGNGPGGLIPTSIDYLTFDPNTGNLIVHGDPDDIERLRGYIALFDVAPKQVVVKVEFISTGTNLSKSLGYDLSFQRGSTVLNSSFSRGTDPVFASYATGNVAARLRASLSEGHGITVDAPIVRTMNNTPASVQETTQTTIFNTTATIQNGQTVLQTNAQQISISSVLNVTPRINADNTIVMALRPQIGDFGAIRKGPDGQEVPDQTTQLITAVVRVRSGETVVMGGFNRKQDNTVTDKFPLLSELPLIGQFFKGSHTDNNDTELLIFVTATIVDEDNNGLSP